MKRIVSLTTDLQRVAVGESAVIMIKLNGTWKF